MHTPAGCSILAAPLDRFMICHGLDDAAIAAWLGIAPDGLDRLRRQPGPAPDDLTLPDFCAGIAARCGADSRVLLRIVMWAVHQDHAAQRGAQPAA